MYGLENVDSNKGALIKITVGVLVRFINDIGCIANSKMLTSLRPQRTVG